MTNYFDYNEATSRNIGLLTQEEQDKVRDFTVSIAGMGGAGGNYLISLIRQGFEKFKIAEFDTYELKNFNRQYGVRPDTVGRKKSEVMKEEALKINPNCKIEIFEEGINEDNIHSFLQNADIVIDAIDLFEVNARQLLYKHAYTKNISVLFAAPLGFSTAYYIFSPNGPSFDDFFDIKQTDDYWNKFVKFVIGLTPKMLQQKYMNQKNVDLKSKRGPSSIGSINLCAGVVVINTIKVLFNKDGIKPLPYFHQFDAMRNIYVNKKLWLGNKNPIQKIKIMFVKRKYLQ